MGQASRAPGVKITKDKMHLLEGYRMTSFVSRIMVPGDGARVQYFRHFDEAAQVQALAPRC